VIVTNDPHIGKVVAWSNEPRFGCSFPIKVGDLVSFTSGDFNTTCLVIRAELYVHLRVLTKRGIVSLVSSFVVAVLQSC